MIYLFTCVRVSKVRRKIIHLEENKTLTCEILLFCKIKTLTSRYRLTVVHEYNVGA